MDATPPTVTVALPACGSRTGRACTDYRNSPRTWSRVRGTVRDTGGSGVASVRVSLVQKRDKTWFAYNGRGWSAKASAAKASDAAKSLRATVSGSGWSVKVRGVRAGRLVVAAVARDGAGNTGNDSLTRTLG